MLKKVINKSKEVVKIKFLQDKLLKIKDCIAKIQQNRVF